VAEYKRNIFEGRRVRIAISRKEYEARVRGQGLGLGQDTMYAKKTYRPSSMTREVARPGGKQGDIKQCTHKGGRVEEYQRPRPSRTKKKHGFPLKKATSKPHDDDQETTNGRHNLRMPTVKPRVALASVLCLYAELLDAKGVVRWFQSNIRYVPRVGPFQASTRVFRETLTGRQWRKQRHRTRAGQRPAQ